MVSKENIEESYNSIKQMDESDYGRVAYNYGNDGDVVWVEGYVIRSEGPKGQPSVTVASEDTLCTIPWHNVVVNEITVDDD